MTTDLSHVHERLVPRGSLGRFGLAGGFNSAVFYIAWTVSMFLFPKVDFRVLWGTFWGLTGIMAHFVHRWYTFDNHKSLRWTLPTAIPVYLASMYGSSVTIGWLEGEFPEQIVWLGIPNLLFWGVIIWLSMRIFVFQFSSSRPHASQEDRME